MTIRSVLTNKDKGIDPRKWLAAHAAPYKELMGYYNCAMMEVETRFKVLNEDLALQSDSNPIESIRTRLKAPDSIVDKLLRNNYPLTVESIENNIYDVAGVRVVCSFQSDVYMLADALLRQDGISMVRKRDYIAEPKPSGYRSLNMVVSIPIFLRDKSKLMNVEVQLRTLAMDCWASLEHKIRYKKQKVITQRVNEELLVCSEITAALDERFEEIQRQVKVEAETGE